MRNWLIAILGGGVLLAVGALLWSLQSSDEGATASPAEAKPKPAAKGAAPSMAAGGDSAKTAPGAESATPAADVEPGEQPPVLPIKERETLEISRMLGRAVPRRLREWVAPCYNDGFSYKRLETEEHHIGIEYTLVRRGGVFSLEDVKLTQLMGKPDLEECVLDTAKDLEWRVAGNASYSVPMSDELTLLDLKKFGSPLPHELEDDEAKERDFDEEFGPKVKK